MNIEVRRHPWARYCHVFLDDIDVSADCLEADEEGGYVVLVSRNVDGKRYPSPINPNNLATERREGTVQIIWEEGWEERRGPVTAEAIHVICDMLEDGTVTPLSLESDWDDSRRRCRYVLEYETK